MTASASVPASVGWLVVGTGRHADRFGLPGLARSRSSAVAVCGSDPAHAAGLADRHGVPCFGTGIDALLDNPAVSHVYVCSSNDKHEQHVAAAAAAGKHVLCEKPLAPGVEAAIRVLDSCRRAGVVLGTGFHLRHNEAHRHARRLIEDGAIGVPVSVRVEYLHAIAHGDSAVRLAASRSVATPSRGAMSGTGAHAVDLARWLLDDDIVEVTARMTELDTDAEHGPHRVVHVAGSSGRGALVTLVAGRARYPDNGVAVIGTRGRLTVSKSIGNDGGGIVRLAGHSDQRTIHADYHDVYAAQFDAFVTATTSGGGLASASGADGVAAQRVVDAVDRALIVCCTAGVEVGGEPSEGVS